MKPEKLKPFMKRVVAATHQNVAVILPGERTMSDPLFLQYLSVIFSMDDVNADEIADVIAHTFERFGGTIYYRDGRRRYIVPDLAFEFGETEVAWLRTSFKNWASAPPLIVPSHAILERVRLLIIVAMLCWPDRWLRVIRQYYDSQRN